MKKEFTSKEFRGDDFFYATETFKVKQFVWNNQLKNKAKSELGKEWSCFDRKILSEKKTTTAKDLATNEIANLNSVNIFNQAKFGRDNELNGYYAIVTNDLIIASYHKLWKIEESFRVIKLDFEGRPNQRPFFDVLYCLSNASDHWA